MKISFIPKRQFMPFLTGPGCVLAESCDQPNFPTSPGTCDCTYAVGGINELYFIPCTETFSQANVTNISWWTGLANGSGASGLGRSGIGLGSITKKTDKKERVGSCRIEQVISVTWALKFVKKCFDKTSARATCKQLNELILKSGKYLVVARMCEGDDTILPIGQFTTSDFNWTVPDNFEEIQTAEVELSWKELGMPCTIDVAGLSTVLPKLT